MSGAKQYHIRTTDQEFINALKHEMKRVDDRGSEAAHLLALARDGLLYRRWMREQAAMAAHQGLSRVKQTLEHEIMHDVESAPEVEHDHGTGGAPQEQDH